jgi:hypothetical protein
LILRGQLSGIAAPPEELQRFSCAKAAIEGGKILDKN